MKKVLMICVAMIAMVSACNEEKEMGVSYRGGWNRDTNARLRLINDSIVKAEFFSSGFSGWYNKKRTGHYHIVGDSLMIIQLNSFDTLQIVGDTLRRNIGKPYRDRDAYGNCFMSQEHYDMVLEQMDID